MRYSRIVKAALIAFASACSDDDEGIVGVSVPGAPARIVLVLISAAGGHLYHDTLTVDSSTARFEVATCLQSSGQSACSSVDRRSGDVNTTMLGQLFSTAQSSEFRKLRTTYSREGNYLPPDPKGTSLTVTVAERTRTISWDNDAILPEVLSRYHCWLNSVRGSLALCAS